MQDNMNICEQVEIAIYSDMVLTDEQKNHIESCPECKALLSQISAMKNDLGSLGVPGIEKGIVTKKIGGVTEVYSGSEIGEHDGEFVLFGAK